MKRIRCLSFVIILMMLAQNISFGMTPRTIYSDEIEMAMVSGGKIALFEKKDTVLGVAPYKVNNTMMIPARYVFENYGYEVAYENNTLIAKGIKEIKIAKDSNVLCVNGAETELSEKAEITNSVMFVPADICTGMGLEYCVSDDGVFTVLKTGDKNKIDKDILIKLQGVYISAEGNDGNTGTCMSPVKTLEKAKKLVTQHMKEYGKEYTARIFVKGGVYRFEKGVVFEESEFGIESYKGVSIENFDENRPVFTGAVEIDSSKFIPVEDAPTLARIPKSGRGNVAVLDLKEQGYKDLKQLPNVFHYIYLDDLEQTCARWPNDGEATVFSVPQTNSFTFSETEPTRWTEAKNVYVFGHFSKSGWEWKQGIIQSVDAGTKTINIMGATGKEQMVSTAVGTTWYAQNLLEELDSPGEWYVDTENAKLYYYPPYRIKGRALEMLYCTDTLMSFKNAKNVTVKGIEFNKCYQPLKFDGADEEIKNITVTKNKISHVLASTAIEFPNGNRVYDVEITENSAYNLFGRFSYFRAGNVEKLKDGNCLIMNNYIVQPSQYFKAMGAIGMPYQSGNFGSVGVKTMNNVIQDIPGGAAISTGGTRHKVLYNEIINSGKYMSDYGAIYCGRSTTFYDLEVAHNFLHHFNKSNDYNALYNDDAYANANWHHNMMVEMHQPCIQAPGYNVKYMYNAAVNCAKTGGIGSRKTYSDWVYYKGTLWNYAHDMFYANEDVYREQYPDGFERLEKDKEFYDVSWDSVYFGNVGIGCTPINDFGELAEYGAKEIERNNEIISIEGKNGNSLGNPKYDYKDEIFVDIKNMNYNFNPESQVAKDYPELLEIDVTKTGLTDDALYLIEKPSSGSQLVYPDNGQMGLNASEITFSWAPVKGASFYRIMVATEPNFENVIFDEEIRENGNFNQITFEDFENDRIYYWKVIAKGIARQNIFEISSIGGPYVFRTAVRDTISKDNLRLAITSFEKFVNEDLKNPEYEFDKEFAEQAEKKLEEANNIYRTALTQQELDKAEEEIYCIVKKSPFFMKIHFENLDGAYNSGSDWDTTGKVSIDEGGTLTFSSDTGVRADAKVKINNRNSVICFQMKLASWGNSGAGTYQGFDIKLNDAGRGYLVVFKKDIIEWQRIDRTLTEIPNDFVEDGKWYEVQAGGINTPNGVLQFFRVDGRIIYAELDQTANQTRDEGWFRIRKNGIGDIQIKNVEAVPEDSVLIDEILNTFKNPKSDKHLETLFIGSSDAMEMGSSELFAKLDKSNLSGIIYPMLTETEIEISRNDVSAYKKIIEEACVIEGYNQGFGEMMFKNKTGFNYNDIIRVEEIDKNGVTIFAGFNLMSDKYKATTNETMLKSDCKTVDELRKYIAECMFLGTVNSCQTCFAGQSQYLTDVLTKENADYLGIDISDYLALSLEDKLKANDRIGNGAKGDMTRNLEQLVEDIHSAVKNLS